MSDQTAILDLLQRVLHQESHSFLLYVRDAGEVRVAPYAREIKRTFDELIHHEEQYLEEVLALVEAKGGHPDYAMAYDMESAHFHYLDLTYLVQIVHEKLARQLAGFRAAADEMRQLDESVASRLADLARRKETDLSKIEALLDKVREKHGTSTVENNTTLTWG